MPTTFNQAVNITTASTLTRQKTIAAAFTQHLSAVSAYGIFKIKTTLAQRLLFHETGSLATRVVLRVLSQALTAAPGATLQWRWRRTLTQKIATSLAQAQKTTYHVVDADVVRLASVLRRAFPVVLSQALTVHQSQKLARVVMLLQRLKVTPAAIPHATYHLALAQAILANPTLARFLGATLSQSLTAHAALTRTFVASPALTQALTVHAGLANTLVLQITTALNVSPRHIPQMIYRGDALLDQIRLTGLYISPNGTTTTWAVNTRTNAITEYMNYNFNSFAPMGLKYVAASASGVYELDGDTDDGLNIIAEVQSGLMRLNGTKLTGLKGVYLAMRGGGRMYVKIISGDGREYLYEAVMQPGLMTTKINAGKGLRTSYLAFNLMSEGQDFDLDTLEFVPMLSDRRV